MSIAFTLLWWHIPAVITAMVLLVLLTPSRRGDYESFFVIIMGLLVTLFTWSVAGFFK